MTRGGETAPSVLVFDVNETLIDLEHLTPLFVRVFGDGTVMREWFAQTILYSQTITLAGAYEPLQKLGAGVLGMLGVVKGIEIASPDVEELRDRMASMPALPDVVPALEALKAAGFRLATLTNSAPRPDGGPLRAAGLEKYFEKRFSVDQARHYKTAPESYGLVTDGLGVRPQDICLVACHAWDTLGAQLFGASSALILRRGNAALPIDGLPIPTIIAPDMTVMAEQMIALWSGSQRQARANA